jgi:DNA-binding transcriptional regulator YhcF (GntR family)
MSQLAAKSPRENAERMMVSIRQAIQERQLRKGERLLPLRQLAEQYSVALSTAALAVGQLEREGLLVKRAGSGTYVTFDPERQDGGTVHLWLALREHVYQELADSLLGLLQERGVDARTGVWQVDRGGEQLGDLMRGWEANPPRALVGQWEFPGMMGAMQRGLPPGLRVIATFGDPQGMPRGWHSVNPDRKAMCELAVEHLIQKGHRRIGFVTYSRKFRLSSQLELYRSQPRAAEWNALEISALRTALQNRGVSEPLTVYYQKMGSEPDLERLIDRPERPTAMIGDDCRLAQIKRKAEQLGLQVPGDLELVGFGDTPWSQAAGFSSISYCPGAIAREIAALVVAKGEELSDGTRHVLVPPKLVVR